MSLSVTVTVLEFRIFLSLFSSPRFTGGDVVVECIGVGVIIGTEGDGAMVACGLGAGVVCAAAFVASAITKAAVPRENRSFFIKVFSVVQLVRDYRDVV